MLHINNISFIFVILGLSSLFFSIVFLVRALVAFFEPEFKAFIKRTKIAVIYFLIFIVSMIMVIFFRS
jgi:hypothetical protein